MKTGNYTSIKGGKETTCGVYVREFHIQPKLSLHAHDSLLITRVRREDTEVWWESLTAMNPSAQETIFELFAALLDHITHPSIKMQILNIPRHFPKQAA